MYIYTTVTVILGLAATMVEAGLRCAQCNGWHGSYPLKNTQQNSCDYRNNQCQSEQFCVKIVDMMNPSADYSTFKADCWFQPNFQVTPTNLTLVMNKKCYDYQDASVPSKRYKYCFCNDRDYCNGSAALVGSSLLLLLLAFFLL